MVVLFKDRQDAGNQLSLKLKNFLDDKLIELEVNNSKKNQIIVLGIPRGGVVLGDVIATNLNCDLDVVISRKIRAEFNEELAIGAVMPDGSYFINEQVYNLFKISSTSLENEINFQKSEIQRRLMEFRGTSSYQDKFKNKIVILVDDGIATGATIIASAQWLKRNYEYKHLVVAVPVAPLRDQTMDRLRQFADKVIILHSLDNFQAVGQFYSSFDQVTDEEVKILMRKYGHDV